MTHITIDKQVVEQALEALESTTFPHPQSIQKNAITALRAALEARKEVEPWSLETDYYCYKAEQHNADLSCMDGRKDGVVWFNEKDFYAFCREIHHPAPAVPEGWLRAVDEALVIAHLGVADADDSYEMAKKKLDTLIDWHIAVATDPDVNGGYQLVPKEPTPEMGVAYDLAKARYGSHHEAYKAMLEAAPEVKK